MYDRDFFCEEISKRRMTGRGLTRSAVFLILIFFTVVHAVRNLHVFKEPDNFNGDDYFCVLLLRTAFGVQANSVRDMRCHASSL